MSRPRRRDLAASRRKVVRELRGVAVGLLAVILCCVGCTDAQAGPRRRSASGSAASSPAVGAGAPTITVSAHRGGAGQWPQDSLLAFHKSLVANYDEIEGDAWITKDGQAVIYHDNTISPARCTGPYDRRDIWTLTAAQVRTVRCQGQPIPTEPQLLDLVADSANHRTVLRLETKSYPGQTPASERAWAHQVGAQVVGAGLKSRAIMQDFAWDGIAGYHAASSTLRVSALIAKVTEAAVLKAAKLGAYDVSYSAAYSTPATNAYIAMHHLVPTVWGTDAVPAKPGGPSRSVAAAAVAAFRRAACQGVKVVITNYPQLVDQARSEPLHCSR
jgi:glycerophosphoryl diester phosphodiesterase